MNEELKRKWVEALRSGRYVQGRGALRRAVDGPGGQEVRHCCLGVLCEVAGVGGTERPEEGPMAPDDVAWFSFGPNAWDRAASYLPDPFCRDIGAPKEKTLELADMNDAGKSFAEIADIIEREL